LPQESLLLEKITFSYGPHGPDLFHCLNMAVPLSGVSLVLGPNGSGKTTLARIITGLDSPGSGGLCWPPVQGTPPGNWKRPFASAVFEEPEYQLQAFEAGEELAIGLLHCGATAEERVERVSWTALALGMQDSLDTSVADLTIDGQLGLLATAMVAMAPRLIVLDFSPSRLDPALRSRLFDLARRGEGPALLFMGREAADILFLSQVEKVFILHDGSVEELAGALSETERLSVLDKAGLALPWYAPITLELYSRGRLERVLFPDENSLKVALEKAAVTD